MSDRARGRSGPKPESLKWVQLEQNSAEDAKSKLARELEEHEEWREGEEGSATEAVDGGQAAEETRKTAAPVGHEDDEVEEAETEASARSSAAPAAVAAAIAAEDDDHIVEEGEEEEEETEATLGGANAAARNTASADASSAPANHAANALAHLNAANGLAPNNSTLAIETYTGHAAPAPVYKDITELLNMPQSAAAQILGIPMSTLSKRWKEAVRIRKWPYRQVAKLDKEIMTLLHNIPARNEGDAATPTPPEIEQALGVLLRRRQEELKPVRIRMN